MAAPGRLGFAVCLVVLLGVAGCARGALDIEGVSPEDFQNVNQECIGIGTNILTFCQEQAAAAEKFFNFTIGQEEEVVVTDEGIEEFIETISNVSA
ncbi:unnamed protein product, partial [Ostreobium quekettii]